LQEAHEEAIEAAAEEKASGRENVPGD